MTFCTCHHELKYEATHVIHENSEDFEGALTSAQINHVLTQLDTDNHTSNI